MDIACGFLVGTMIGTVLSLLCVLAVCLDAVGAMKRALREIGIID